MDVLHPRCAGLDVHKDFVMAAVRLAEPAGVRCEVRRFETTTPGLLALGERLMWTTRGAQHLSNPLLD